MDTDLVESLVKLIEVKDLSTAAHTWRVVLYSRAMAEEHGLSHDLIERITMAAALHDVGKLDVPDAILQKPGPLTAEERGAMERHTLLGHERLLSMSESDPVMLELVRHHHERWDGRGYPDGLAGEAIPLTPRVFSVIDTFDAMTSVRPYRMQVGERAAERALEELHAHSGTRYWPEAVEMFTRLYRTDRLTWILHYYNDQCPVPYVRTNVKPGGVPVGKG